MKKFSIIAVSLLLGISSYAFNPGDIDAKLLQSFNNSFPNAKEVKWSEQEDLYMVTFSEEGVRSRIIYPKDGTYTHLTRYYMGTSLPLGVLYKVNKEYPDKKVYCVVEVSTITEPNSKLTVEYYVKMEDPKNWITIKLDNNGSITVVEKYRKAL